MFATGIENSIPTINHGKTRVDEMEVCGHYERWREDFDCVQEIGINYPALRPADPQDLSRRPTSIDWEFADLTFAELKRRDITPIVDLCHFGVPDWIGNFQNPDFPRLFADLCRRVRRALPVGPALHADQRDVHLRGLLGEIRLVERAEEGRPLVRHRAQAHRQSQRHGDDRDPEAPPRRDLHPVGIVGILPRRLARPRSAAPRCSTRCASSSLDLNYGRRVDSGMYQYLLDNGMTREEYEWFLEHRLKQHCILGNDYYQLNEHRVFADGHTVAAGETFGYSEITRQYYNRYRLPVMHTETNLWEGPHGDEAVKWLWKEWANVLRLRNVGIPTVGFTWYCLTDQVDWDTALREQNGNVNPLGLFDLDRKIRNVGKAYKQLIADWRNVLPAQSVCLIVPIKKIGEHRRRRR